ncbi:MAG TPA: hypothetical protein VNF75_04860 [Candidatus Dormibacteraeota bacterium]|nr:hypothetical protein [Candidatus Dormibacteraeota bacterium]
MSDERTPAERIGAFFLAVDEEILRPLRRYQRGFRRGLVVGCVLGLLFTPAAGGRVRARVRGALRCHRRQPTRV